MIILNIKVQQCKVEKLRIRSHVAVGIWEYPGEKTREMNGSALTRTP